MRRQRSHGFRWDLWILVGWCAAFSLMRAGRVQDTDPYWQVRAGQEWLDGTPLARPDTWSWAPVDGLFYPNSPLWNAALAVSWGLAESWGMFVLTAVTIGAYYAVAVHLARQLGASLTAITAAVIVTSLAALPMLSPRAGVPSQVLLLAGIAAAYWWSHRARAASPLVSAVVAGGGGLALSWLGNWVHLSWSTTALGLSVAWAAIWLLTPALGAGRRTVLILAGTAGLVAGIGLGPYGWSVFDRARAVVEASAGVIEEWSSPFGIPPQPLWGLGAVLVLGAVLGSAAWCWRAWRFHADQDVRLPLVAALTCAALPFALLGMAYARFVLSAVLVLGPLTAVGISAVAARLRSRLPFSRRPDLLSPALWQRVLGWVLVVLAPLVLVAASAHAAPSTTEVAAALPQGCRLFSAPDEASSILLTRTDVSVWVDGRSDYWGRTRLQDAQSHLAVSDPTQLVPSGTTCVLLPRSTGQSPSWALPDALDASPQWQRAAENGQVILWLPAEASAD